MQSAPKPPDELQRRAALYSLDVLDSEPDKSLERITRMARRIFDVPMALVTFMDEDRQWIAAGLGGVTADTPRELSFCGYAILGPEVFAVRDTKADERFTDSPFVTGDPAIRFYAGAPLTLCGQRVGTICVLGEQPRDLSSEDERMLLDLAATVEAEFANTHLAVIDELTGLYNRRGYDRLARQLKGMADRQEAAVTVFALDLDDLKAVNDALGHAAGDAVIGHAADLLRSTFRSSDVIARVGGDEFGVLVFGPCDTDAVRARLEAAESQADVHFSHGWSMAPAGNHRPLEEMLAEADEQMYLDKAARKADDPA